MGQTNFVPIFMICHAELVSASIAPPGGSAWTERWTLKHVQGDDRREDQA